MPAVMQGVAELQSFERALDSAVPGLVSSAAGPVQLELGPGVGLGLAVVH